jgi:hypothetical protein
MKETPQEYTKRIVGNVVARDPMKVLAATPKKLEQLIRRRTAAKLRKRPSPEKWSVSEIIAHLADNELVRGWRIRQILGAPGTPIQAFDQDAWAVACHYGKQDAHESLVNFRAMRECNQALLKVLEPEQWKNYGMHAERGRESIEHIVRMAAGHDINHIQQIERILASEG